MYRELLPATNERKLELQTGNSPSTTRERLDEDRPSSRTKDGNARLTTPNIFSDFQAGGNDRGVSVENTGFTNEFHGDKHAVDRDLAELLAQTSSPVVMPDSPAQAALAVHDLQSIDGSLSRPAAGWPTTSLSPSHTGAALVKTTQLNKPTPPLPLSKLKLSDMQLIMPPSKQSALFPDAERSATQPRSLRRVLSENDSTGYQSPDAAMKSVGHALPEAMSPANSKPTNQRPFKGPIKLTKSLSDTAARPNVHIRPAVSIAEEDPALDCGPWSKVESYLLFDWFPPGRARLMLQGREQSCSGMIVEKGGLLSDQVDAL